MRLDAPSVSGSVESVRQDAPYRILPPCFDPQFRIRSAGRQRQIRPKQILKKVLQSIRKLAYSPRPLDQMSDLPGVFVFDSPFLSFPVSNHC